MAGRRRNARIFTTQSTHAGNPARVHDAVRITIEEEPTMSVLRSVVFAMLCVVSGAALAQAYPARPVKIVVGFAPGSATDIIMRLVADQFSTSMGQPFIIENKPGAGGSVGAAQVKNAAPDGYTLVAAGSGPFGINPAIQPKLPYDAIKDFELITNIVLTPQLLVVGAQSPYQSLKELVAAAKARPVSYT